MFFILKTISIANKNVGNSHTLIGNVKFLGRNRNNHSGFLIITKAIGCIFSQNFTKNIFSKVYSQILLKLENLKHYKAVQYC